MSRQILGADVLMSERGAEAFGRPRSSPKITRANPLDGNTPRTLEPNKAVRRDVHQQSAGSYVSLSGNFFCTDFLRSILLVSARIMIATPPATLS